MGKLLFAFKGRINRARYWLATLVLVGAYLAALLIAIIVISLAISDRESRADFNVAITFIL